MSETKEYLSVGATVSGAAKIHRVGSEEGGRSWSLEFDPESGRPTEALWQHQRLHVCGQCQDCKHYKWRGNPEFLGECMKWFSVRGRLVPVDLVNAVADPGTQPFDYFMPPLTTFGCTEWEAKGE